MKEIPRIGKVMECQVMSVGAVQYVLLILRHGFSVDFSVVRIVWYCGGIGGGRAASVCIH